LRNDTRDKRSPMAHRPTSIRFSGEEHRPFHFSAQGGNGGTGALLIHGFMGTPKEMRPLGEALAVAGIAVHGPLLPGFGERIADLAGTRAVNWVRAAGDAWDEVYDQYPRRVLVGFSMGGAVAIHVAARRPPDRLILLAPLSRLADWRAVALPVIKHVVGALRPFERANFADPFVRQSLGEMDPSLNLDDPAVQERLRRETELPTAALDELRRVAGQAGQLAPRVAAPALVVQGSHDRTVLPAYTRRLAGRLGGPLTYREVPEDHLLVDAATPTWPMVRDLVVGFATDDGGSEGET
ncbi:MAG: alpha/beta fold hydrolase, partial [Chloroflexota bacterium]|nr:alpha/beta fold hydrolase [Chloroflexota bacterium]